MFDLTASIVLHQNKKDVLLQTVRSFLRTKLNVRLYLVDNSPTDVLRSITNDERCEYLFSGYNGGFGHAHNQALKKALPQTRYHLVLNPDIEFLEDVIPALIDFMDQHTEAGLVMPLVLGRDGSIQYVARRLPSPLDLIIRRMGFGFLKKTFGKQLRYHEMRDKAYDQPFEAPSLSGCFMFFRSSALQDIGFFDERFFMYMEDIDLTRRMAQKYKTICNPTVKIFHEHARESYHLNRLLFTHVLSAIKYFNKWGWLSDSERVRINRTMEFRPEN